jgi:thioredoxin-related protein
MKALVFTMVVLLASFSFAAEPTFINNYEEAIRSDGSVLVVFGTQWCENCVRLKKDINKINLDDYVVCVLDAEIESELSKQYKVKAYPTSIVFKKGTEISRKVGYKKFEFERWTKQYGKE